MRAGERRGIGHASRLLGVNQPRTCWGRIGRVLRRGGKRRLQRLWPTASAIRARAARGTDGGLDKPRDVEAEVLAVPAAPRMGFQRYPRRLRRLLGGSVSRPPAAAIYKASNNPSTNENPLGLRLTRRRAGAAVAGNGPRCVAASATVAGGRAARLRRCVRRRPRSSEPCRLSSSRWAKRPSQPLRPQSVVPHSTQNGGPISCTAAGAS